VETGVLWKRGTISEQGFFHRNYGKKTVYHPEMGAVSRMDFWAEQGEGTAVSHRAGSPATGTPMAQRDPMPFRWEPSRLPLTIPRSTQGSGLAKIR
jgi:hypothetical protein